MESVILAMVALGASIGVGVLVEAASRRARKRRAEQIDRLEADRRTTQAKLDALEWNVRAPGWRNPAPIRTSEDIDEGADRTAVIREPSAVAPPPAVTPAAPPPSAVSDTEVEAEQPSPFPEADEIVWDAELESLEELPYTGPISEPVPVTPPPTYVPSPPPPPTSSSAQHAPPPPLPYTGPGTVFPGGQPPPLSPSPQRTWFDFASDWLKGIGAGVATFAAVLTLATGLGFDPSFPSESDCLGYVHDVRDTYSTFNNDAEATVRFYDNAAVSNYRGDCGTPAELLGVTE